MKLFYTFLFMVLFGAGTAYADGEKKEGGDNNKKEEKQSEVRRIVITRKRDGDGGSSDDANKDPKDESLRDKAAKEKLDADKRNADTKQIEKSLTFTMGIDDFVKKNADILPKDVNDIVRIANKETYDTVSHKANAIKASLIQSFFSVQANVDALTKSHRETLDDYLKLTNTGKQEKAATIYENILEPALDTHRKVKKAEELGRSRSGYATGTEGSNAYRDKLLKGSRRTYLNQKEA